jgi:hypothetical protein
MALRLIEMPIRSAKVVMAGIWYELAWVVVWTGSLSKAGIPSDGKN